MLFPSSLSQPGPWRLATLAAAVALLSACAQTPTAPRATDAERPSQWYTSLPSDTQRATPTSAWWPQFNDPLLVQLVNAAQAASPSLAAAQSRIAQARALRVATGAALGPTLDASASASRSRLDTVTPLGTTATAGVQATWELDLFGARHDARRAAQARLDGAQANGDAARVAVAAELATHYTSLRACEAQLEQQRADTASRAQTAQLIQLNAQAGFEAPANARLARASAAQARSLLTQRQAQCDSLVKGLVALTGLAEPALREQLAAGRARIPQPAPIAVASVPAQVLAQRPDVFSAEREWLAAQAEASQAQAERWPRIQLAGSIGALRFDSAEGHFSGSTWSVGPVTVSLPLFDGGTRRARVDAAQARVDESAVQYRATLRTAVREVEDALIALQSTADREADAQVAAEGYVASFRAIEARFKTGLASLLELEDVRRTTVQAQMALIDLHRERCTAWIDLYRALGGGWSAQATPAAAQP